MDGRLGLIIDGTAKDVEKTKRQKDELESLGYDTMMVFVNTNMEVAQDRNKQRDRQLPDEMVVQMWHAVQDNLMKFQQLFGNQNFYLVDNSGGLEDPDRKENFEAVEGSQSIFKGQIKTNEYILSEKFWEQFSSQIYLFMHKITLQDIASDSMEPCQAVVNFDKN